VTEQLNALRRAVGSRCRKLSAGRQALPVLRHLRCGDTYIRQAAGSGIGAAILSRYVAEIVDLLAAAAPTVTAAVS
jgi:Helix-turn-helix of DDE superfamily endonuclease